MACKLFINSLQAIYEWGTMILHDLVLALLKCYPNETTRLIKSLRPDWKLFRHNVKFVRAETKVPYRNRYIDVIWVLRHVVHRYYYVVVFEVTFSKTTAEKIQQILDIYSNKTILGKKFLQEFCRTTPFQTFLCVIVRNKYLDEYESKLKTKVRGFGNYLRLLPIEPFYREDLMLLNEEFERHVIPIKIVDLAENRDRV